jgi:hypothetical protein
MIKNEFRWLVRKYFGYLFDTYGFVVEVSKEERDGEYRLVVLSSSQCKIRFYLWQDVPEVAFGGKNANAENGGGKADGKEWFDINTILRFLMDAEPERQAQVPVAKSSQPEDVLARYALQLKPYAEEVIRAFSPEPPAGWWQQFEAYRQMRRRQVQLEIQAALSGPPKR